MPKEQVLVITPPSEISFKGPYNRVVTEYFSLHNPTDSYIAFKVKTTAPKRYCVRPNNGVIAPKKQVVVSVMLQPQNKEEINNEKHKHKFMIQSVISQTEDGTVEDIFKQSAYGEIMDSKFRCVFEDVIDENPRTPDYNQTASRVDINDSVTKQQSTPDCFSEQTIKEKNEPESSKYTTLRPNVDGIFKDLVEENKKLQMELQSLRTKANSPGSGRITGAIPVVAQQQNSSSFIIVLFVAIFALVAGVFIGMNR